jgi:VRR-NUC domain
MSPRIDEPRKPSLRISHVVYGRRSEGRRVKYLVDPRGQGDEWDVPETVVLRRWRRRTFPGYTFSGTRLSSTLWRALPVWLGRDVAAWHRLSLEEMNEMRATAKDALRSANLIVPDVASTVALLAVCLPSMLRALVDRHAVRGNRSGVPDLFLFAKDSSGRSVMARFVEVKKPEEPVSDDQVEELDFMIALGLHARVLRLQERKLPRRVP